MNQKNGKNSLGLDVCFEDLENPIDLFKKWFSKAKDTEINDPNAVAVATSDKNNQPNARMVLLKGLNDKGFVFYTNFNSKKGSELKSNQKASMCFHWKSLRRQVRVLGKVEEVSSKEADEYYLNTVSNLSLGNCEKNKKLGVVFTPLHGTGGRLVPELLRRHCFEKVKVVEKQMVPDGEFPTVASPNPEDIGAFNMSVSEASDEDELILANDPDADRLGVMIRDSEKKWHWLTGNQIGVLILDFILSNLSKQNLLPKNGVIFTTVVTSPLVSKMAEEYGLKIVEVLTGFKWIRQAALKYEKDHDSKFVFGMEESHGYLRGNHSGDKDGIWASLVFAEMVASHKANNLTALDRLNQIYQNHGTYLDVLETRTFSGTKGKEKIQQLMKNLRDSPPKTVAGNSVVKITDFLHNTITFTDKASPVMIGPGLPPSNVISIELEDSTRIIARPSGTEPKIKYYFNLCGKDSLMLEKKLDAIKQDFLID